MGAESRGFRASNQAGIWQVTLVPLRLLSDIRAFKHYDTTGGLHGRGQFAVGFPTATANRGRITSLLFPNPSAGVIARGLFESLAVVICHCGINVFGKQFIEFLQSTFDLANRILIAVRHGKIL
jgi:hypothetical protein